MTSKIQGITLKNIELCNFTLGYTGNAFQPESSPNSGLSPLETHRLEMAF